MTVFTRTWNSAYESNPADGQNASEGAARIRETKVDIGERLGVDHSWAGDVNDGMHKQITLVDPLASKPSQLNDETYIYSKDVDGTAELFYEDEAGNEVQLTTAGVIAETANTALESNTRCLFQQASAPTLWTIDTTVNDYLLRLVDGSTQTFETVGSPGGDDAFTTAFSSSKAVESHVLSVDEMPAHTHTQRYRDINRDSGVSPTSDQSSSSNTDGFETLSTGGGSGHVHDITLDPSFVDVIIAVKD